MIRASAAAGVVLSLALAGCAAPGRDGSGAVPLGGLDPVPVRLVAPVPTGTGIDIPGTGREIGFGRHLPGAAAALTRLYGAPVRRACDGGAILGIGALELHFEGESFSGWRQGERVEGRLCAT